MSRKNQWHTGNKTMIGNENYYLKSTSRFSIEIENDECEVKPSLYQPTPEGLLLLARHYSLQYGVKIQVCDTRKRISNADHDQAVQTGKIQTLLFSNFKTNVLNSLSLKDGKPQGFILSHAQHHAIPFILSKESHNTYMIILDSTVGPSDKNYWAVAEQFPKFTAMLNYGARQLDGTSCMTDSICILKDGLLQNQLGTLIKQQYLVSTGNSQRTPPSQSRLKIRRKTKPKNLFQFRMPEVLLKTAQNTYFFNQSKPNLNALISPENNLTLLQHRDKNTLTVQSSKDKKGINIYLNRKSREHSERIDNGLRAGLAFCLLAQPNQPIPVAEIEHQLEEKGMQELADLTASYLPYSQDQ